MLTDLFGGPVSGAQISSVALNAEIPWAGGCLLGTKSLSWQKGRKPRKKAKGSQAPWQPVGEQSLGAGATHTHPGAGAVPGLTGLSPKAGTNHWASSSISVAIVRLTWTRWDWEALSAGHSLPPRPFGTRLSPQGLSCRATRGHPAANIHSNTERVEPCICGYHSNPGKARCTEDQGPIWRTTARGPHSLALCGQSWAGQGSAAGPVRRDTHTVHRRDDGRSRVSSFVSSVSCPLFPPEEYLSDLIPSQGFNSTPSHQGSPCYT